MGLPTKQAMPTSAGVDSANTRGTSVTSGGSAGTYTSTAVVLVASSDQDACGFILNCVGGAAARFVVKVMIGTSSNEVELGEYPVPAASNGSTAGAIFVPIFVPAGSRISVKTQSSGASQVSYYHVTLVRGESWAPLVSRGRLIATLSSGEWQDVDAGGTANTKGAWTVLSSSLTNDIKGFTMVALCDPSNGANARFLFDVAYGGTGSEQIVLADIAFGQVSSTVVGVALGPYWIPAQATQQVQVRCASNITTSTANKPVVALIGWE